MDPVDLSTSKMRPPFVSTRNPFPTVERVGGEPVAMGGLLVVAGLAVVDVVGLEVVGEEPPPGRHW